MKRSVHGRDEPDEIDIFGKRARAPLLAGDAHGAARRLLALARGEPGADLDLVPARHDAGRDREAAGAVFAAKLVIVAPAQAMARAEQRDRFEQIGLARAVLAHEHDRPGVELELGPRIVAEIGELQAADEEQGLGRVARDRLNCALSLALSLHTRIGIST